MPGEDQRIQWHEAVIRRTFAVVNFVQSFVRHSAVMSAKTYLSDNSLICQLTVIASLCCSRRTSKLLHMERQAYSDGSASLQRH